MTTLYRTKYGTVLVLRTGRASQCKYNVFDWLTRTSLGTVSRRPPWGDTWQIVDDAANRTFKLRRCAIEALQKAAT